MTVSRPRPSHGRTLSGNREKKEMRFSTNNSPAFRARNDSDSLIGNGLEIGAARCSVTPYFKPDPTAFYDTVTGHRTSLLAPYDTLLALPVLIADNVADDTSTTSTITVDGAHIISTINTIGDQDFFKVELEAG